MKVTANTASLAKALGMAVRVASRYPQPPVLSAVHLRAAEDEVLHLAATNGELSLSLQCPATAVEPGELAVPAKILSEVTRSLPVGEVELSGASDGAQLVTANSSYTLRAYDPTGFPAPAQFPTGEGRSFTMPSEDFKNAVSAVLVATSKDEKRPVLSGALVAFEKDHATFVSTDAYRLCLRRMYLGEGPEEPRQAIIPASALREAMRLAALSDTMSVALTENAAMFSAGNAVLATRLVEGAFPDYERLLPESFATEVTVNAQALKESLKRVNLFVTHQSHQIPVRLAFSAATTLDTQEDTLSSQAHRGGALTVSAAAAETGSATEVLDAGVSEGADIEIAFDGAFLADGVDTLIRSGSENIVLRANEPLKPAVLCDAACVGAPDRASGETDAPGQPVSSPPDGAEDKNEEDGAVDSDPAGVPAPETSYLVMPMRDPLREHHQREETPAGVGSS